MSGCKGEGATHYEGCPCHEARRDAELEALKAELAELKDAISWEGRDAHLAAWRKECYNRDQSCSVLDSDIVSLIDRAAYARTQLEVLKTKADRLAKAMERIKNVTDFPTAVMHYATTALADYRGEGKPCDKCMGGGRVPGASPARMVAPGVYEQKAILALVSCPDCNGTGRKP